jgi:hypothetical protein
MSGSQFLKYLTYGIVEGAVSAGIIHGVVKGNQLLLTFTEPEKNELEAKVAAARNRVKKQKEYLNSLERRLAP